MFTSAARPISHPPAIFAGRKARTPADVMGTGQLRSGSRIAGPQSRVDRRALASGRDAWPVGDVETETPLYQVADLLDLTGRGSSEWRIACLPIRPHPFPLVLASANASVLLYSRAPPRQSGAGTPDRRATPLAPALRRSCYYVWPLSYRTSWAQPGRIRGYTCPEGRK